jgi:glucose-1-phosphate thymidylyltransferase
MRRKGILLAGGTGSRLFPMTRVVSKQLLPVYDKPMIYYPLTTLMSTGVVDVLVISTQEEQPLFRRLLGDGSQWGIAIHYAVQEEPRGIAQALLIARSFLNGAPSVLALGDNLVHGEGLEARLSRCDARKNGATIFAHWVAQPEAYGVVVRDPSGRPVALDEKPRVPRSNFAVPGLYFYDPRAPDLAGALRPSARGELEITDLNRTYLAMGALHVEELGRGYAWFDAGTPESLLQAAQFVSGVERGMRVRIGCPEEVALRRGLIDAQQVAHLAASTKNGEYGAFLAELAREGARRGAA